MGSQNELKSVEYGRLLSVGDLLDYTLYLYRDREADRILPRTAVRCFFRLEGTAEFKQQTMPAHIIEEKEYIYISENVYNACSSRLVSALRAAIRSREDNGAPIEKPILTTRDIFDLKYCNTLNRQVSFGRYNRLEFSSRTPSEEEMRAKSRFDSIMSNQRIKYVFSTKDNFIHDKSCPYIDNIPYIFIKGAEDIPNDRIFCRKCCIDLLIRKACGDDFKKVNLYKRFFFKGNVFGSELHSLILDNEAKIRLIDLSTMQIKCHEDTWRIIDMNDRYILMHNNYTVMDDNSRYISKTPEYHKQGEFDKLYRALIEIKGYSWADHLKYRAELEQINVAPQSEECDLSATEDQKSKPSLFKSILQWIHDLLSRS